MAAWRLGIGFLVVSIVGIALIGWALKLNYSKGFDVRWRLTNFLVHCAMLVSVVVGVILVKRVIL